ncbi:hypothetical protein BDW71DRAFT_207868 [Aspergillus fruticulosus]
MTPEEIPVGGYTHLIFSFLYIDLGTYELAPMESNQTDLYARFTALKEYSIETWISIGGWAMNDPGAYANVFSTLAASTTAQQAFLDSLVAFLDQYGFDGVDIDWEYPGASDRFGTKADYANFVSFLQNVRSALGSSYGLSITLPSSYWYLQYFDIAKIAETIDWFNFMSYDIYGTWDATIASIGSYVYASTNLTMIESGLQLLWHNNISSSQVNLGLGYYGRTCILSFAGYTLEDPSCVEPGCAFTAGGNPGPCTQTEGMLSYDEIMDIIDDPSRNPMVWLDSAAAVKIAVYDDNQWVAYDDAETLQMKLDFANSECMGGVFAWAVDEDNTGDLSGTMARSPRISEPTNGGVSTTTTTISVPEFEVTAVPFWPLTTASNQTSGFLSPVQSIAPPSLVLELPGSVTPFPQSTVNYTDVAESQVAGETIAPVATGTITSPATTTAGPTSTTSTVVTPSPIAANMASGCTGFYQVQSGDSCWSIETNNNIATSDFEAWNPDVGTGCANVSGSTTIISTSTGTTVVPVFYSTSHSVTIQPQATHTTVDPSSTIPPINVVIGPPSSSSSSSNGDCDGCGTLDCELFGCDGKCGLFGCDGGCDLWWCGGGCGLHYCGPGCGTGSCVVEGGGGGGGSTGSIGPGDTTNDDCSSMKTADICTVFVKSFSTSGMASSSTTSTTECAPTEGCSVTPSTTTTTISTTGTYSTLTNSFVISTSISTTVSHGTPTATFHSPSNKNHIEMNFYKDDSCGELIAGYERDNDPLESSGYCAAWGLKEYDGGNMVASSIYPVFSESDWNLGFMSFGTIATLTFWASSSNPAHVISSTIILMETIPRLVARGLSLAAMLPTGLAVEKKRKENLELPYNFLSNDPPTLSGLSGGGTGVSSVR